MRIVQILILLLMVPMISCQRNFDPVSDSTVRDVEVCLLMSQTNADCRELFDDYGEADAFRATAYLYDKGGILVRQYAEIYRDYQSDTLKCILPKIDTSALETLVIVGNWVNVNEYGDVASSVIHQSPEKLSELNVYTLTDPNQVETFCAHAIIQKKRDVLQYQVNLEPTFSHFFLQLGNASDVLRVRYSLSSKVFYYFMPRKTSSTLTVSGSRYNTYSELSVGGVLSYIPDGSENILDLDLLLDRVNLTTDTLEINQDILLEKKIYSCYVDCKTLLYECL